MVIYIAPLRGFMLALHVAAVVAFLAFLGVGAEIRTCVALGLGVAATVVWLFWTQEQGNGAYQPPPPRAAAAVPGERLDPDEGMAHPAATYGSDL
jgi:hypothetical protein